MLLSRGIIDHGENGRTALDSPPTPVPRRVRPSQFFPDPLPATPNEVSGNVESSGMTLYSRACTHTHTHSCNTSLVQHYSYFETCLMILYSRCVTLGIRTYHLRGARILYSSRNKFLGASRVPPPPNSSTIT